MDETVISYWYCMGFRRGLVAALLALILAQIITYYLLQEVFASYPRANFTSSPRATDTPPPPDASKATET